MACVKSGRGDGLEAGFYAVPERPAQAFAARPAPPLWTLPMGVSMYPKEIFRASRRWAEKHVKNIAHWNDLEKGGHFAAWEQPELFVKEIRDCFRQFR